MKSYVTILCAVLLTFNHSFLHGQNLESPLASGTWAKFSVDKNGVFKIDADALTKAGFAISTIDPRKLKLYGFPTGMLPQANAIPRSGLKELAIQVIGESDGTFNPTDFILFYGQGPDESHYDASRSFFAVSNNIYSDRNFYFLTVGDTDGKRIAPAETGVPEETITDFLTFAYYETDSYNELKSGREWFGEAFDTRTDLTIRFPMEGIVTGSEIQLATSLMAQTYSEAKFQLSWNNVQLLERVMPTVPQTQYGAKGRVAVDTLTFFASDVAAASTTNQDISLTFVKGSTGRSVGYLNYLLFQVRRKSGWYGNPTLFTIPPKEVPYATVNFASPPGALNVWDVTDPFNSTQTTTTSSGTRFVVPTSSTRDYAAFVESELPIAAFESKVANQALRVGTTPDLIIVTHPDFRTEADRLANHRANEYGIEVAVVSTEEIYNEFSGGRQDLVAIRDYVRWVYSQQPGKLKNLLLFGRGSYDYKKRVFNNTNFVPTYESRNSLNPLDTYSSDDFFGFLEENEGEWSESPARNHSLDIGVGRLPIRTLAEAKDVVDKLITYDTAPDRHSAWRQGILFVADDGDFNIHQNQAEELAESMEAYGGYATEKVYVDAFEQEDRASGQISPKAADALNRKINQGFAIVNFTGHGSEQVWMQERILDSTTPSILSNNPRLPLFVTATCEFGRHDDPQLISTAELLVKKKKAGAIALVTTTRPVNSGTNFSLNKAFYAAFFKSSTGTKDLGSIFRETKNNSQSGVANRNFSLLGDPSLRFGPPPEQVVITQVKTTSGSDTIKALSKVIVEGRIETNGEVSLDFDGTLEATLFDKQVVAQTLGDENPVFNYKRWAHPLFHGKATVVDGEFAFEMVLPSNLASEVGKGKLVLYAFNAGESREALGTFTNFKVGEAEANPEVDTQGPSVQLFMGDTTFVTGGITNSDTRLVGVLHDKSGINFSGYDGTSLTAVLDGATTFVLNDYYSSNQDDFTSGYFAFPIYDLTPGLHTLDFSAFDTYGNETRQTITFEVGKEGDLQIENLTNFPNPFSGSTTIRFAHSRSGEDLEAQLQIFDTMGQVAGSRTFRIDASTYQVDLFDWDGTNTTGTKMNPGIYFMKLSVRSLSDGAKKEKIAKLIMVN